jgi:hypothetical protein
MPTFREEMLRLAEEFFPGNEQFAELMSNAADTQERIAKEVLKLRKDVPEAE